MDSTTTGLVLAVESEQVRRVAAGVKIGLSGQQGILLMRVAIVEVAKHAVLLSAGYYLLHSL